jgi:hypothetical protein
MFQHTQPECEDTRKLVHTINKAIGEGTLPDAIVDAIFEKMWPELASHLEKMPKAEEMPKPLPTPDDMIAEILELSRAAANSRKEAEWLDPFAADFKNIMPTLVQGLKGLTPSQLLPAPPPQPLPREPKATFCIKLAGNPEIKRVQGTVAALIATGEVAIFVGNEVVAKFESVEAWWKETPDALPPMTASAED